MSPRPAARPASTRTANEATTSRRCRTARDARGATTTAAAMTTNAVENVHERRAGACVVSSTHGNVGRRRAREGRTVRARSRARSCARDVRAFSMSFDLASEDEEDGDARRNRTRLQKILDSLIKKFFGRAKTNLVKLPVALISLLVGFSMCALIPHPESPQDAFISFTIILLSEFVSSVLYGVDNQGGLLRWLCEGPLAPIVVNCFKIGVLYGLFCDAFKVGS